MSSEQTCICLTHAVYTKCENSCCEKEPTIYPHNGSIGFRNLTQQWVSWSSPVSVETQTRVTEGQKMGGAEAIQTEVVYFQRYHCLSLSLAYRYLRNEWNTDIRNELSNLGYRQKSPIQSFFFFFVSCLRLGLLLEACSPNSDLGSAQKILRTADSSASSWIFF